MDEQESRGSEPASERTLPPPPEVPPDEAELEQLVALARQYGCEILAWRFDGRRAQRRQ